MAKTARERRATLYARFEPTDDPILHKYATEPLDHRHQDLVFYDDAACTRFKARHTWHFGTTIRKDWRRISESRPVTLNCCAFNVEWAPGEGRPS